MEYEGKILISNNYTSEDFLNIHLSPDSLDCDWEKAIKIFKDRFQERYFTPISKLLEDPQTNGFAIMALNCLLIDTFFQFEAGVDRAQNLHRYYIDFLKEHMGNIISSEDIAKHFYYDIRCGILHSAETKNGSILSFDGEKVIECLQEQTGIKVNVVKFSKELEDYFNRYIDRLLKNEGETRINFIKKMELICK